MSLLSLCPRGPVSGVRIAAVSILSLLLVQSVPAHEGHDHDDAASVALVTTTLPRLTAQSELYELVGILRGGQLHITIDALETNEPVTAATVQVTIGGGDPIDAKAAARGTYVIEFPRSDRDGSIDVIFNISMDGKDDLLVGQINPQPGAARSPGGQNPPPAFGGSAGFAAWVAWQLNLSSSSAPAKATLQTVVSDAPRRLPDGTLFVAKPTQRLLDVRTVLAKPEMETPAVKLIGRVIGNPNRTSVVQSLHGGRVIALDTGLPSIGQTVRKGDALVKIDPYLPQADRTTIAEKTGEIEQLIAVAEARIRRLRPLAATNTVPQSQVTDLETELEGLRQRRESMRNSRGELEVLRAQSDGVISLAKVVPGQVVQAQDLLFQIVDPKGLWVEALAYGDLDPSALSDASGSTISGHGMALKYEGFSPTLQQHASVVRFSIPQPPQNLAVGQPLTVLAKAGKPVSGIILRRDALVRNANGESIVWTHTAAERFEAKPVRTLAFDGTRVIVLDGVTEKERIVVRGAELINQVR